MCSTGASNLASAQETIVNINPRTNSPSNPVNINLMAGDYLVEPIGVADGASFDAWSNWSFTTCADPDGCIVTSPTTFTGWRNRYNVTSLAINMASIEGNPVTISNGTYEVEDGFVYPSGPNALGNSQRLSFTLPVDAQVGFSISDGPRVLGDNRGGLSLRVRNLLEGEFFLSTRKGGNTGTVTVTVGNIAPIFEDGMTVRLAKVGEPKDILGAANILLDGNKAIQTTFNLTGETLGSWDVVLIKSDQTKIIIPGAFTIEQGVTPQVWVDLVGRSLVRLGRPNKFSIFYGNRGNVDAIGAHLWITGIPKNAEVRTDFSSNVSLLPPGNNEEAAVIFETDEDKFIPLKIGTIPGGFAGTLTIEMTLTELGPFEFKILGVTQ